MTLQDTTTELLTQAENALLKGDRQATAILINKVLKLDFTNERAWLLLYRLMGSTRPFADFQVEFATRYYPEKVHLLAEKEAANQGEVAPPLTQTTHQTKPSVAIPQSIPIQSAPQPEAPTNQIAEPPTKPRGEKQAIPAPEYGRQNKSKFSFKAAILFSMAALLGSVLGLLIVTGSPTVGLITGIPAAIIGFILGGFMGKRSQPKRSTSPTRQKRKVKWGWILLLVVGLAAGLLIVLYLLNFAMHSVGNVPASPVPASYQRITVDNAARLENLATNYGNGDNNYINSLAISPDNKVVLVGRRYGMYMYAAKTLTEVGTIGDMPIIESLAFSPDGQTILNISSHADRGPFDDTSDAIQQWRVTDKTLIYSMARGMDQKKLAISPDGRVLAIGGGSRSINLYNTSDGVFQRTIEGTSYTHNLAFSPDGQTLASAGSNKVALFNVSNGNLQYSINRITTKGIAFSPDGQTLAVIVSDCYCPRGLHLYQVSDGKLLRVIKVDSMAEVVFSPDGQILTTMSSFGGRFWNVSDGALLFEFSINRGDNMSGYSPIAFSSDGKLFITGNQDKLYLWGIR